MSYEVGVQNSSLDYVNRDKELFYVKSLTTVYKWRDRQCLGEITAAESCGISRSP
jgi:hypothetical protein